MPTAPLDAARLTAVLASSAIHAGVAGAQVSVASPHGRLDAAWGQARPGCALDVHDRMQIGSIAKLLTAVLVHQLVDDGRIALRDDAACIGVEAGDPRLAAVSGITVGQLLSMTSGLDRGVWASGETVAEALGPQLTLPRMSEPGRFGYSFAGTMVAARLVELLGATAWFDAVLTRIARPLGIAVTDTPTSPGHEPSGEGWVLSPSGGLRGMGPTGTTLCASAADLAVLGAALADPDGALLSPPSRRALHTPVVEVGAAMCADVWCSGPYARRAGTETLHGHGGRWAGGVSDLTWHAGSGTAVAIVTNTPGRGGALVRRLSRALHPLLWGEDSFVPTPPMDAADPSCSIDELDALTGRYSSATRVLDVVRRGHGLVVAASALPHPDAAFELPGGRTELRAVGPRRFLPRRQSRDERRLQEFWFSAETVPDILYDGFVAASRD